MSDTTTQNLLKQIAERRGFSLDAVLTALDAMAAGGGTMAQFDHPEFGGPTQWMRGGMLMTADAFDHRTKARIDALCSDLAPLALRYSDGVAHPATPHSRRWWPEALGQPDSSGAQNDMRYAYFAASRKLAIDDGTGVTIYDTGDHRFGGFSQQQGAGQTMTFSSQHGVVPLAGLARVETDSTVSAATGAAAHAEPADPLTALERLALLHARGVVNDTEFAQKKAELLSRV